MPLIPNLRGLVHEKVAEAVRRLAISVYELEQRISKSSGSSSSASPLAIKKELEVGGSAPLNVTQLLGTLAQPQPAYAPTVSTLPDPADPQSQDGTLIGFGGVLYRFNESTNSWSPATSAGSVTSVGLTQTNTALGAAFTITGTPVTTTGNLNLAITSVLALCNTNKVTAAAPYTNDGYIVVKLNGNDVKLMTTA